MRDAAKVREFRIRLNLEEEEGWEIVVRVPNFEGNYPSPVHLSSNLFFFICDFVFYLAVIEN